MCFCSEQEIKAAVSKVHPVSYLQKIVRARRSNGSLSCAHSLSLLLPGSVWPHHCHSCELWLLLGQLQLAAGNRLLEGPLSRMNAPFMLCTKCIRRASLQLYSTIHVSLSNLPPNRDDGVCSGLSLSQIRL